MAQARRHAYLHALGIDPWVLRATPESSTPAQPGADDGNAPSVSPVQGLQVGPGDGDILLVCKSPAEAATRLASDIARCLDSEPVYSWPMPAEMGQGLSLRQAIEKRLFTRVLVFGNQLEGTAGGLAAEASANVIATARIVRTKSIAELAESPAAKRALWLELCSNDWCAARAGNL